MMLKIKIPKDWGPKTKKTYEDAIKMMALKLKQAMICAPGKYDVKK